LVSGVIGKKPLIHEDEYRASLIAAFGLEWAAILMSCDPHVLRFVVHRRIQFFTKSYGPDQSGRKVRF
jgi:hypothetical protein